MKDTRLIEQRNGVSFLECLEMCLHSELLPQWERLWGKKLTAKTPIERMVDEATGYDLATMAEFADFCYTHVFCTLPG